MQLLEIPLTSIEFGERFRKDYGDVEELARNIDKRGLIQPLAVVKNPADAEKPYKLLAGGRRYLALSSLEIELVPARVFETAMSDLELRLIELAENIYRKDFEWTEEVKLKREIHDLQIQLHGEKVSTSPDATGWSLKDTAEYLSESKSSTQKDIKLAKAVEAAPDFFAECQSKADAAKVLKTVTKQMIEDELIKRAKAVPTAEAKKSLIDCYILEDFLTGVKKIENKTINFVEFDPPNEIPQEDYATFISSALTECYRVMTDHSWMVVWVDPEPWFELTYNTITSAGFTATRQCGIWIKPNAQSMQPEQQLANSYEMFFVCRKGKPTLAAPGRSNIFKFSPVPPQFKIHPTERPLELMDEILKTFCLPGSSIMIPCLGSGNTLLSAQRMNMKAFGYEISRIFKDRYMIKVHKMEELG